MTKHKTGTREEWLAARDTEALMGTSVSSTSPRGAGTRTGERGDTATTSTTSAEPNRGCGSLVD